MKPFDACALCLQQARDPMSCLSGHIYCRECIYKDLLSQKNEIKRRKARIEALQKEEEAEQETARIRARERVVRDFERSQIGLRRSVFRQDEKPGNSTEAENGKNVRGVKRKFEPGTENLEDITREAEAAALLQIQKEQTEARKAKLPDFWLPSLTPEAKTTVLDLKDIKLQTLCNASAPAHPLSLKTLIPVTFSIDASTDKNPMIKICPSCKKELTTNSMIFLMRPCSHVVCKSCQESLVAPAKQCAVCDKQLSEKDSIQLSREGTGFAGGGRAETSKVGIAFQG